MVRNSRFEVQRRAPRVATLKLDHAEAAKELRTSHFEPAHLRFFAALRTGLFAADFFGFGFARDALRAGAAALAFAFGFFASRFCAFFTSERTALAARCAVFFAFGSTR